MDGVGRPVSRRHVSFMNTYLNDHFDSQLNGGDEELAVGETASANCSHFGFAPEPTPALASMSTDRDTEHSDQAQDGRAVSVSLGLWVRTFPAWRCSGRRCHEYRRRRLRQLTPGECSDP
jgi:hypothetical protein